MKINAIYRIFVFLIVFLFFGNCFITVSLSQKINQNYEVFYSMMDEGQILYSPMYNTITYLRESNWVLNHTWSSSYFPGVAVWWLGDGTILRTIRVGPNPIGGAGGGVQKVEWDGTVVWDFRYNTNGVLSHHDVKTLPNGNVLLIAWESKSRAEAIAAGRNPSYVTSHGLWIDHIIEVEPTGPTGGNIVWEWHAWDHLIQDYDSSKDNYGVVGDYPELIDINYRTSTHFDIMHTNSVDYIEEFDQILISVCNYNEIWVIDHSTTTEEAAGHTGGNYGKGGDLLYRWGNPRAYDRGTTINQKFFGQHDASWIKEGYPGEGNILVFNNGVSRFYSSVDEIIPPVNEDGEYYLEEGEAFGPGAQTWIYTANPPGNFYSGLVSGAHRLENGNTLITNGNLGVVFEVTPEKETVWQHSTGGSVFKVCYIAPPEEEEPPEPNTPNLDCSGSLYWYNIAPGATVTGSFQVQNIGDVGSLLNWTIDVSSISWGIWTYNPESGEGLTPEDGQVTVQVSLVAPNSKNSEFDGFLRIENQDNSSDYDTIPVYLKTQKKTKTNMPIIEFLKNHLHMFSILQHLLLRLGLQ